MVKSQQILNNFKKNIIMRAFITTFFLIILVGTACTYEGKIIEGNGKITSEKRTVNNISKIKVEGSIEVVIDNGLEGARIVTDENLIPYIVTEKDGDLLKIKVKENANLKSTKPITVYLSTPLVTEINLAGSGNVVANGRFSSTDRMGFEIAGSGNITIDVNSPKITTNISGSGTVHITGETKVVNVQIAGSGTHDGFALKAEDVSVKIAGSGDAMVYADINLKVSIAGSGNIKYKGNATVDKNITGSGDVIKEP